jgi:Tol biopolymer transport system component
MGRLGRSSLAWANDRLVFVTGLGGRLALSLLTADRPTPEEVVIDADSPAATSDGRTIVYASRQMETLGALWKADGEGRRAVQLFPDNSVWPIVTPDDRNVVFGSARAGRYSLWMMPLEGGSATQIADVDARSPDVSRDGKSLGFVTLDDQNKLVLVFCDFPSCSNPRSLVPPAWSVGDAGFSPVIRWAPDGSGLAYVNVEPQPNIWVQPLNGSPPRQLTHFTDGRGIYDFAWSRDGSRLAIVRATITTDIILFKGLRP